MASKSVQAARGDVGLDKPAPKRRRRNTAIADNGRSGSMSAARKKALGLSHAALPKQPKRPANSSARAGDDGSEIGRRVGHGKGNVKAAQARPEKKRRDRPVDTSKKGVAADDRRVGSGHTARRNTKLNMAGMTAMLEDSATGVPSRKSTRRAVNRHKPNQLTKRAQRKASSPQARHARGRATAG
ncbi:MAG: hypothetical protein HYV09_19245 [Deltaproteobacteria bacterium]|nr:hypothetical protein [Deltaproteobacteria bacterium]